MTIKLSESAKQKRLKMRMQELEEKAKRTKKFVCKVCGLPTYNSKKVCVLCETGITALYKSLKEEKNM